MSDERRVKYIPSLTPLRGIAALMVVLYHYDIFLGFQEFSNLIPQSSILAKSYLWVDFFFILSGFIICHVYGERLKKRSKGTIKKYLWARFSRLYPLHFFVMLIFLARIVVLNIIYPLYAQDKQNEFHSIFDFFAHLFWLQTSGITNNIAWNVPSWSIAAEWWIYIMAILLFPILNNGFNRNTIVSWFIALIGLTAIAFYNPELQLDVIFGLGTWRCLFEFTIGIGVYQVYQLFQNKVSVWSSDWLFYLIGFCVLIGLHIGFYDVLIIPFFSALILCAALNLGKASGFLNIKALDWLGEISFSLYLTHVFWLDLWMIWLDLYYQPNFPNVDPSIGEKLLWVLVLIILILITSHFTYRYIELRAQKKLRRMFT